MALPITDDARRVVIIGPGKIGCGYLAPLFAQAGWQVVLAARSPEVVGRIAAAGHFDVRTTGEAAPQRVHAESVLIGGEDFDRAVAGADLVATAVGMSGPRDLGLPLARALATRGPARPVDVWAVENADVGPVLRDAVRSAAAALDVELPPVGFASAIAYAAVTRGDWRTSQRASGPEFVVDDCKRLRVNARPLVRALPALPGVGATRRYEDLLRDKRFVFGAGHALCAYLGLRRGHRFIHEAVRDPLLLPLITSSLDASRAVLGDVGADASGTVEAILDRYANSGLRDPLQRVARDPMRKLGPEGPLVGPTRLITEATGRVPAGFAAGIAAALRLRQPGDRQARALTQLIARGGAAGVLEDVCGINPDEPLGREVLRLYDHWAAPAAHSLRFAQAKAPIAALAA
jgi:mannitol-1-phosphate 5-dehydrogenase